MEMPTLVRLLLPHVMVEFGQYLLDHRKPEWRGYYMNYSRLKGVLKEMEKTNVKDNTRFIEELKLDIIRVATFYSVQETIIIDKVDGREGGKEAVRDMKELEEYAGVNEEGLRKIAKKYDKLLGKAQHQDEGEQEATASLMDDILLEMKACDFHSAHSRLKEIRRVYGIEQPGDDDDDDGDSKMDLNSGGRSRRVGRGGGDGQPAVGKFLSRHASVRGQHAESTDGVVWVIAQTAGEYVKRQWMSCAFYGITLLLGVVMNYYEIGYPRLTSKSYISIVVTVLALSLLVRQYPPDAVMTAATLILCLTGVLDNTIAWQGFANEVVLSVAILLIVSAAVKRTGVVEYLFIQGGVLGKPNSLSKAILRLFVPAIMLNIGVSNTAVMGVLLPVVKRWCEKDIHLNQALLLMPLSYILLISGVFAVFSTSSNLITQGLLIQNGLQPLDMFAMAPIVLPATIAAIVYIIIAVPIVFKEYAEASDKIETGPTAAGDLEAPLLPTTSTRLTKKFVVSAQVTALALDGVTLEDSGIEDIVERRDDIVEVERMGSTLKPTPSLELQAYDIFHIYSSPEAAVRLYHDGKVSLMARDTGELLLGDHSSSTKSKPSAHGGVGLFEVVLDGLSPLVGKRIEPYKAMELYGARIVGIRPQSLQILQQKNKNQQGRRSILPFAKQALVVPPLKDFNSVSSGAGATSVSEAEPQAIDVKLNRRLTLLQRLGTKMVTIEEPQHTEAALPPGGLKMPSKDGASSPQFTKKRMSLNQHALNRKKTVAFGGPLGVTSNGLVTPLGGIMSAGGGAAAVPMNERDSVTHLLEGEMKQKRWHLKVGDGLIVEANDGFEEQYGSSGHFAVVRRLITDDGASAVDPEKKKKRQNRMWLSGAIVLMMILLVATNTLPLLQASMSAVFALILTGCIPLTKALAAVNLRTVLTIVGAFGLGQAISITNVATVLAQGLVSLMRPLGSIGMLSAIFIATCLLGVVFHATAVVILLFPVCVSVANEMAMPVHQCLGPLMVGAGCQFLTPISYQTNLMVYAAAGYDFSDFARLGLGLTIVVGVVAVPLCLIFL
ncbi:hypothetical protein FOZ63_027059 [Perkinsus olseni]|uniref:SPX domain-containing protein n=2 Tax=Perkinsus olseni TaxID=32597 RepID=A0A7J6UK83_PEROL|nr:hypothetical protein FOZ63_027059 [Perkinsus olseni]